MEKSKANKIPDLRPRQRWKGSFSVPGSALIHFKPVKVHQSRSRLKDFVGSFRSEFDKKMSGSIFQTIFLVLKPKSYETSFFSKDGPTPASFSFIFIFSYKFSSQQDSNTDHQSRRQESRPLDHSPAVKQCFLSVITNSYFYCNAIISDHCLVSQLTFNK